MIRVAIVDDHPIVTEGIVANVNADPLLAVVATGATFDDALVIAQRDLPDVLVLDLELGPRSGLDAVQQIKALAPARPSRVASTRTFSKERRATNCWR